MVVGVKADLLKGEVRLTLSMNVRGDTLDLAHRLRNLATTEMPVDVTLTPIQEALPSDAAEKVAAAFKALTVEGATLEVIR